MDEIIIRKPTIEDEEAILDMVKEFREHDSVLNGHGGIDRFATYKEWLEKLSLYENEKTVPEGRVPATQFVTVRVVDNKIVGLVNARWKLNSFLKIHGGHIGDSIRPTERNKGYATEQIRLVLELFKNRGVKKVLITCKKENLASERTIVKNGGVLENEVKFEGDTYKRFWVNL